MEEFLKSLIGLAGVPVVAGLVQAIKAYVQDSRLYPFIAIVLALIINLVVAWAIAVMNVEGMTVPVWVQAVFQGIMGGLAASGLYSTVQTVRGQ